MTKVISSATPASVPAARIPNEQLEPLIRQLLVAVGEDPDRPGLLQTPQRVAKSLQFLLGGYGLTPHDVVANAIFEEHGEHFVIVRNVEFASLCEHHMLPFFGKCHVAYRPRGRVIGLSKVARIVDLFARRLQVQERMTAEIARAIADVTGTPGVAVITRAEHMCMRMRGVRKTESETVTTSMLGDFQADPALRQELMALLSAATA